MRLNDDEFYRESKRGQSRLIMGALAAMATVTVIMGVVLFINKDRLERIKEKSRAESAVRVEEEEKPEDNSWMEGEYTGDGLTSDDLDFWNMYDESLPEEDMKKRPSMKDDSSSSSEKEPEPVVSENEAKGVDSAENDEESFNCADTGEKIIPIDESIPRNDYVADGFRQEGNELQYYWSNRKVSSYGVDLSKYQGTVDWEKLSETGIDFAMIRMGVRGYSTAAVVFDEEFENNIKGANEHGIDAGIYFLSQAISVEEAEEEANYAVAAASAHTVTYPIVFYAEDVVGETSRSDALSPFERTAIARCFCDKVRSYGYKAMIGGSKHTLSTRLNPGELTDYDVWLVDAPYMEEGDRLKLSEYPYRYTMWQYSSSARLDGIDAPADLDISFVDYKYR